MSQVSAFVARSNVDPEDLTEAGGRGYSLDKNGKSRGEELDYVQMLNGVLPSSIRVSAWAPVPEDFNARFSCRGRHYRYFFTDLREELDIEAMRKAAGYFIGEHDFRNFCKLDVAMQITNFKRTMLSADIVPYEGLLPNNASRMWMFDLKGTAFLWHQVRCMMSILFLVGQSLEKPEIVMDLLDMEKYRTKPSYEIAHDTPLVLYDCDFDGIVWRCPERSGFHERMMADLFGTWHEHKLRETMTGMLCKTFARSENGLREKPKDRVVVNTGSGIGQAQKQYRAVVKRSRLEAFEVTNERYRKSAKYEEKQRKLKARAQEKEEKEGDDTMEDI
jgi:tRNA pseudouridine38/39 synthase